MLRGQSPVRRQGTTPRPAPRFEPSTDEEVSKPLSAALLLQRFEDVWKALFTTPVHLDSALSKLPKNAKTTLAQIIPAILLRPASQAEALGIGVAPDEPWSLPTVELPRWRPARMMAERLHALMSDRATPPQPHPEDFPPAMTAEWERAWGRETVIQLTDTLGREPPLALRASRTLGAQGLLSRLTGESRLPVKASLSRVTPLGVSLAGYAPILGTDLFKEGAFEIQDEGSQVMSLFALWPELFVPLLQERPGPVRDVAPIRLPDSVPPWTVVDACAGAGGKSLAMADALGGKGRIFSYDISAPKLQALRRRATRAGFNNIQPVTVKEGEEAEVVGRFRRRAHAVLVDAPCSGWGVLRRNPDIKWRQSTEALARMPSLQLRLLSEYSRLVAGGGRLVYGVCTFRELETRNVVRAFLEAHPEFEAGPGGYLGPGPCDGFFMQSFSRRGG